MNNQCSYRSTTKDTKSFNTLKTQGKQLVDLPRKQQKSPFWRIKVYGGKDLLLLALVLVAYCTIWEPMKVKIVSSWKQWASTAQGFMRSHLINMWHCLQSESNYFWRWVAEHSSSMILWFLRLEETLKIIKSNHNLTMLP